MTQPVCRSCGSCGFPMRDPVDFAAANVHALYCSACATDDGRLKAYDEVLRVNADYLVGQQGLDPSAARQMAAALLATMPAWKHHA